MKRIIAIDDDEGILYTLKAVAKLAGFELSAFSSPHEGLQAFAREHFDLALVDYHMPGMDGALVIESMRKIGADIPIIVLTVDERLELVDRLYQAGADDFAVKPVKAPDLISRLRLHLEGRRRVVPVPANLPKGISFQTMDRVLQFVGQASCPVSLEDISNELGLAYQTASRYLDYLGSTGRVRVELEYLQRGRPRKMYSFPQN